MNECVYNRMKNRKEKIFRWNESALVAYNRMKNRKEKIFRWNESALVAYLSGGRALYYTSQGGGRYIIP
ncbi:hypothetical protein DWW55_14040, partial [Paraprevotella clara]